MFRQFSSFIALLLMLTSLAGCGNTGDLYLPEDQGTTQTIDTDS
ncbi:MAG: hypothetical protein HOJ99_00820 [Porticoccaceae bacterium]|nr:hypothetical protein [Porticoccaceae bacterium]